MKGTHWSGVYKSTYDIYQILGKLGDRVAQTVGDETG